MSREIPPILWGQLMSPIGARMVLIKQGTKYAHLLFMDGNSVVKKLMPLFDLKHFKEVYNSDDELHKIKGITRRLLGRNSVSGGKWEMTRAVRTMLKDILELESTQRGSNHEEANPKD